MLLTDLFRGRSGDIAAMHERMAGLMKEAGLPYRPSERLYNTRLAQELGKWGESQGKPEIHDAFYRANFVDHVNLAEVDVLLDVAARVGLPVDEARHVLEGRTMRAAIDADWQRARALGVTGVPTFVAGGAGVVGAQPYEVLERLAIRAGAKKRGTP